MKNFHRLMIPCAILAICITFAVNAISAQATVAECEPIYRKFLESQKGPELDKLKTAVTAGNDYLAKCSGLEGQDAIKVYVTKQVPKVAEVIKTTELINQFNTAVPAKNWDEAFSSGKELIASNHPATLDVMITLASIGLIATTAEPQVDKFNSGAITYGKAALQKLNDGATSETYGLFQFGYKTKNCPDGKLNAVSWMNYVIGRITYSRLSQQKAGVPYLFAAHKTGCELKDDPEVYRLIGAWYVDDAIKLVNSRAEKIKAAGDQETDEIKADSAAIKGYLDRGIDAYARAYLSAKNKNFAQVYRDSVQKRVEGLFDNRYNGDHSGMDKFIAEVMNTPFPDPATPIRPVVEPPAGPLPIATTPPKKP